MSFAFVTRVVGCSLFVACCLLRSMRCVLCVVCCWPFFCGCFVLLVVSCVLFDVVLFVVACLFHHAFVC